MKEMNLSTIDRRRFVRGAGFALALPWLESFSKPAHAITANERPKRLACFYMPDGVPMPLPTDPAYQDWSWFPHGNGTEYTFTKCLEPLESLRQDMTVLSGLSNPAVRKVMGHSNGDQFLTAAATGSGGEYQNSISMDQVYAAQVGEYTRFASLVMSTDGGTGSPRGAQTLSFDRHGRAIPAENRPKRIFDRLFATSNADSARKLATSKSALDDLLADTRSLKGILSLRDQKTLDEYLQSVREAEIKVEKAKRWLNIPLPSPNVDHLNLEITPEEPRMYVRTMYELIFLAFQTDSTRVATYQIGRESAIGISDRLGNAVGFPLTHRLSHATKEPGGWENFGTYCRFLSEEFGRFAGKLKATPEAGSDGSMLDNTLLFFGSASSAFHLSRNYPLLLVGGKHMGFKHGQYFDHAGRNASAGAWLEGNKDLPKDPNYEDLPLSNLFVTMLQRLGVQTESFADSTGEVSAV